MSLVSLSVGLRVRVPKNLHNHDYYKYKPLLAPFTLVTFIPLGTNKWSLRVLEIKAQIKGVAPKYVSSKDFYESIDGCINKL